ncbi:glutathione S-transferase [Alkalimarinus alittae]|uniref:Glutathione S-transferase n=1 Tax=Alkalimarinus alittae TaxID=2961619 RepID=A0ABY6MZ01_9ALTE|nr:glutathione S-transferase [Alkalimarinus alittae]UZE95049.1 glutathione S-transferase [Alkalimarinus alittae]
MTDPILYSLQNCPYAIRARLGLFHARQPFKLRAVVLKNIPTEMLAASAKATVPVLVLGDADNGRLDGVKVIDESLDIMFWALKNNDPQNLLYSNSPKAVEDIQGVIARNDHEFIANLENYKYSKRYHDFAQLYYRDQCEQFVADLEQRLSKHDFFVGDRPSVADYAILPFIRQFARVDRKWYLQAPYPNLRRWLDWQLQQPMFTKVMAKYPPWLNQGEEFLLGT